MKALTLATVPLVILGLPLTLFAGVPYEALDAGDVFVATITRVEDKDATNARPPRVWLEVHEVLRGDAKTARSPAVWSPPFHGIDWVGGNASELLKQWKARPYKGPKVGQKFILGGKLYKPAKGEKGEPDYHLFSFVRIPYSDKARTATLASLAALDAEHRKYADEQAAEKKERDARRQEWRAALSDRVIDQRTQEADVVAIGQIVGSSTYEFETLLKGKPPGSTSVKYYVTLPSDGYDKRIVDLVNERPRCILFLSDKNLVASTGGLYAQLVDPYEGIVVADDAAIAAVKASLKKHPPPKPRPVLVISALNRADAAPLAEAARASFVVVTSHQFGGHGPNSANYVRQTIPYAAYFVMIDGGPERRVQAVQITGDGSTVLYEGTWAEKEVEVQVKALAKKLAEKAN